MRRSAGHGVVHTPEFAHGLRAKYYLSIILEENRGCGVRLIQVAVTVVFAAVIFAAPASSLGPNLLSNPGFEQDLDGDQVPDSWTFEGLARRNAVAPHSGSSDVQLLSTIGQNSVLPTAVVSGPIPAPHGGALFADAWNMWESPTAKNGPVKEMRFRAASGHPVTTSPATSINPLTGQTEFVIPCRAESFSFAIRSPTNVAAVTRVDDAVVTHTPSTERILNGDFSRTDPDAPLECWNVECPGGSTSRVMLTSSNWGAKLVDGSLQDQCLLWQQFPQEPGAMVRASARIISSSHPATTFVLFFVDASSSMIGERYVWANEGGVVRNLEVWGTAPPGTTSAIVSIQTNVGAEGTVIIDDISISSTVPVIAADPTGNLLLNPGFESGTEGWMGRATLVSSPVHSGNSAARADQIGLDQRVSFGIPRPVIASVWVNSPTATEVGVCIKAFASNGALLRMNLIGTGPTEGWKRIEVRDPGAPMISIGFCGGSMRSPFLPPYMDSVGLTVAGTPAS